MKKHTFYIAIFILFVSSNISSVLSQTDMTDEKEAANLSRQFYQQFEEAKDLSPLIPKFFANDFWERYLKISKNSRYLFLPIKPNLLQNLNHNEAKKFYATFHNFFFLGSFYHFSRDNSQSDKSDDESIENLYPPDVWKAISSNRTFRNTMLGKDKDPQIKTVRQLRNSTLTLNKGVKLLQNHISKNTAENNSNYRQAIANYEQRIHLYDPWTTTCDDNCYGFPHKSKLIYINIPFFQLEFMKVNGEMKIMMMYIYTN